MKTFFMAILATIYMASHNASADISWQPSVSTSCEKICSNKKMTAVSTGIYNDQKFYVCSMAWQEGEVKRPGYNLKFGWDPKGEACYSAVGLNGPSVNNFDCLCEQPRAAYPTGPFDIVELPDYDGITDIFALDDGGFVAHWSNKFKYFDNQAKPVGSINTIEGKLAWLPGGDILSFTTKATGTKDYILKETGGMIDHATIWTSYVQRFNASGISKGSKIEIQSGTNRDPSTYPVGIFPLSRVTGGDYVLQMQGGFRIFNTTTEKFGKFTVTLPLAKNGWPDYSAVDLAVLSDGNFAVLTQDGVNTDYDLYTTRYNSNGKKIIDPVRIHPKSIVTTQDPGKIVPQIRSGFNVVYARYDSPDPSTVLLARSFDKAGTALSDVVKLKGTNSIGANYFNMTYLGNNCSLIYWAAQKAVARMTPFDVIKSVLVKGTQTIGTAQTLVGKENGKPPTSPYVSILKNGQILVAWSISINSKTTLRAQVFSKEEFSCSQ